MKFSTVFTASALSSLAFAAPHTIRTTCVDKTSWAVKNGINYTVYDHCATNSHIELVKNSGICETTKGVNQYSGYISFGATKDVNMFFWFFEARQNASTAPLATWFNGGPGCSSMIGLFQENGPCHFVNGSDKPSLNPYSWNNYANMLYVDQPTGTGFSYGGSLLNSTNSTAPYFWNFLQAFYSQFPQYDNKDLGIFSESYGGHYAPSFIRYIQAQNAAIDAKKVSGIKINVSTLAINNGWYNMKASIRSYIDYAISNPYRKLITLPQQSALNKTFNEVCAPALDKCQITKTNADCYFADNFCDDQIYANITSTTDFDVFDLRAPSNDPNPPSTYNAYLLQPAVMKAIGARVNYSECSDAVYQPFNTTADEARSSAFDMSSVVASGVNTLMWHGDADFDCNWVGGLSVANDLTWSGASAFRNKPFVGYTVNGTQGGQFKTQGNFTFLRVYQSGHEVPFYQPKLALQVFQQAMQKKGLTST